MISPDRPGFQENQNRLPETLSQSILFGDVTIAPADPPKTKRRSLTFGAEELWGTELVYDIKVYDSSKPEGHSELKLKVWSPDRIETGDPPVQQYTIVTSGHSFRLSYQESKDVIEKLAQSMPS